MKYSASVLSPGVSFEPCCTVTGGRSLAQGAAASCPPSAEDARVGHWDAVLRELPFLWGTQLGTCVHPASSLQRVWHLRMLGHQGLRSAAAPKSEKTQLAYCIPVNGKSQLKLNHPFLKNDKKE